MILKFAWSKFHRWKKTFFNFEFLSLCMITFLALCNVAALFYLFEGFALQRGIKNTGLFFSTQMGVMIVIRLVGGRNSDLVLPTTKHERVLGLPTLSYNCHGQTSF